MIDVLSECLVKRLKDLLALLDNLWLLNVLLCSQQLLIMSLFLHSLIHRTIYTGLTLVQVIGLIDINVGVVILALN